MHMHTYVYTYIYTQARAYIHTYREVSMAEWLAWLTSNCRRIGAIGSSPSNGLKPSLWGQMEFNPLCQCVYVYVCIVKPDIQTIHRYSHTSILYACRQTEQWRIQKKSNWGVGCNSRSLEATNVLLMEQWEGLLYILQNLGGPGSLLRSATGDKRNHTGRQMEIL